MTSLLVERPMTKRNDVTVKIDSEVVAIAKMVAAGRKVSLAEYLSDVLSPIVKTDLDREYERRNQAPPKGKGKGSK